MSDEAAAEAAVAYARDLAARLTAEGFPQAPASVLMALMAAEDGSLTARQLSERLQASPAAVSGAVRYLRLLGIIRVDPVPGTRQHRYTLPESPPWYTVSFTNVERYRELAGAIQAHADRMGPGGATDRAAQMAQFFRFLEHRMPELLQEWQAEAAGG